MSAAEIRIDPLSGLRAIVVLDGPLPGPAAATATLATDPDGPFEPLLTPSAADPPAEEIPSLFASLPARGAHELIEHAGALAERSVEQAQAAVDLWRERMRAHDDAAYVHVGVDENAAGESRAQLHAFAFVPAAVARERERFGAHALRTMGANLLEDLVAEEVRRRERVVAIDGEAVLWCPYASRHPYALTLAPRRRRERFQDDGATGAALLHHGLTLLARRLGSRTPLSLWVRTAPRGAERFCWRIDVVARPAAADGLELGTEIARNPVAPERAAADLRALR